MGDEPLQQRPTTSHCSPSSYYCFVDPVVEPHATLFNPWCSMVGTLAVHYGFDVALYDRLLRKNFLQQGVPRDVAEVACVRPVSIYSCSSSSLSTSSGNMVRADAGSLQRTSGVNNFPALLSASRGFENLTPDQRKRVFESLSLLPCKSTAITQYSLILILWFLQHEEKAVSSHAGGGGEELGLTALFLIGKLPRVEGRLLSEPERSSQFWKSCYFAAILGGHADALNALLSFAESIRRSAAGVKNQQRNSTNTTTTTSPLPTFGIGHPTFLGQLMKIVVDQPPAALALARNTKLEMTPNPLVCAVRLKDQMCIKLCLRENPSLMVNTPEKGVSVAGTVTEELQYYYGSSAPMTSTVAMAVAIENQDCNSIVQVLPHADASFFTVTGKSAGYQYRGAGSVQMNERGTFPRLLLLARPDILRLIIRKAIISGGRWQEECDFNKKKVMDCFKTLLQQGDSEMVELMMYWLKGYEPNGYIKEEYLPGSGYNYRLIGRGGSSLDQIESSDIEGEPPLHCCLRALGRLGVARKPMTYRSDPYQRMVELMTHFGSNPFLTEVHSKVASRADDHSGTWNNVFHALASSSHLDSYSGATTPLSSARPGSSSDEERILDYFEAVIRQRGTQIVTWEDPRETETAISRIFAAILRQMIAVVDSTTTTGTTEEEVTPSIKFNLDPNPNRKRSSLELSSTTDVAAASGEAGGDAEFHHHQFDESPLKQKPNFVANGYLGSGLHLLEKTLSAEREKKEALERTIGGGSGKEDLTPCLLFQEFLSNERNKRGGGSGLTSSCVLLESTRPQSMGCMSWKALQLYTATLTAYNSNGETPLHLVLKKDCPDLLFEMLLPITSLTSQACSQRNGLRSATTTAAGSKHGEAHEEREAIIEREADFASRLFRSILNLRDRSNTGKTLLHHGASHSSQRSLNLLILLSRFMFAKSKEGRAFLAERSGSFKNLGTQQQQQVFPPLGSLFLDNSLRDFSKDRLKAVDVAVKLKQHEALIALQVPQFPLL